MGGGKGNPSPPPALLLLFLVYKLLIFLITFDETCTALIFVVYMDCICLRCFRKFFAFYLVSVSSKCSVNQFDYR